MSTTKSSFAARGTATIESKRWLSPRLTHTGTRQGQVVEQAWSNEGGRGKVVRFNNNAGNMRTQEEIRRRHK